MNPARMSPERRRQIKQLFERAIEYKAGARRAFLDVACAGDEALRREVESLLAAHEKAGGFMDKPAFDEVARMLAREQAAQKTPGSDGATADEPLHHATTVVGDNQYLPLTPGVTLGGRYLIERELGHGGFGQVFLARDLNLPDGAQVAIKVLGEDPLKSEDRDWHKRKFSNEIKALSQIKHPGVVSATDQGQLPDGRPYFVMQYVPGKTLRSVMTPRGIIAKQAGELLRKIAQAVDAAHERGVIHRDLKPENIMLQTVGDEEFLWIIDFGIATVPEMEAASPANPTKVVGTRPYMAPEQLQGRPTAASDIFALGVIVFEMVTGQRPFNADSDTRQIELQRVGAEEKLLARLPEAARTAILKAMTFEASGRYVTATEFSKAFNQSLAKPGQTDPFQTTPITPALRQFATRRRWMLLAAALIALLAVAGTIAWRQFSPAITETPIGARANSSDAVERSLIYSLLVQKNPKRYPDSQPVTSPSNISFEAGDQVRLNVSSPHAGYLYVINEGPARNDGLPEYVVMFPNAGESAQVSANQTIQIPTPSGKPENDWFEMDEGTRPEKVLLIWSERIVAEMEAVKLWANPTDMGLIGNPVQIRAVADYLIKHSATVDEMGKDETNQHTMLKGKGAVLVWTVELNKKATSNPVATDVRH
ncbi:MAG: serine/threonine protein kinase [Blastocatellia bacterium]